MKAFKDLTPQIQQLYLSDIMNLSAEETHELRLFLGEIERKNLIEKFSKEEIEEYLT